MEIKNLFQSDNLWGTENVFKYIPSSSEKKRAIMMYLFFGIMVSITKKDISSFEYYHLKQASGRRILFLFVLIFDVVLLYLPFLKYLWIVPFLILLIAWIINVKRARNWKYFIDKRDSLFDIFSWIGNWFIDLFEISVDTSSSTSTFTKENNSQDQNTKSTDLDITLSNKPKKISDIEMDLEKK